MNNDERDAMMTETHDAVIKMGAEMGIRCPAHAQQLDTLHERNNEQDKTISAIDERTRHQGTGNGGTTKREKAGIVTGIVAGLGGLLIAGMGFVARWLANHNW